MGQPITIPVPLKGLNTVEQDTIAYNSGYAREFTNFGLYNSKARMRSAVKSYIVNTTGGLGSDIYWFDTSGNAILKNGNIRVISNGTGATSIGGACQTKATRCKHASLDLVIGLREPRLAASPFTAWTFTAATGSPLVTTAITSACSHKGRLYVSDGANIEYSAIAQITGAMQGKTNISSFLNGQAIQRMFSVSPTNNGKNNLLVVFGDGGKILAFAGDYPASSNWQLIGSYDMATPASNVSYVEIDGNIWISTREYAYWLLDVLNGSPAYAYENSPSRSIEDLWQYQRWLAQGNPEDPHTFFDPFFDAIICQCSQVNILFSNYGNEAIYFVYFRKYKAWSVWAMASFFTPVIRDANNNLYASTYDSEVVKLTPGYMTDFLDYSNSTYQIYASWKTPYIGSFKGSSTKINSVRPYFKNTYSGYLEQLNVISDYSDSNVLFSLYVQPPGIPEPPLRYTSASLNLPTNTSNFYNGLLVTGGDGDSVSIQTILRGRDVDTGYGNIEVLALNVNLTTGGMQS